MWDQVVSPLVDLIGKFLPCRSLFSFKLRGLTAVVGVVAIGWSFKVGFELWKLNVKVDGPDIAIAIAVLATLGFLTAVNAVLKWRRDRLIKDLVPLTLHPGCPAKVRDAIVEQLGKI